ncbi:MAG: hypothetical protein II454_08070 [Bacteroidales bacterium]|nr:hypothetical protein [Bacteroidales bacterium]
MRRAIALISALLCFCWISRAQVNLEEEFFSLPDSVTNSYLDSVKVSIAAPNDYWMIGVFGGASAQYGYFNPDRYLLWQFQYPVYGFSVVRHFTMFGIFPNMGMEFGAQMNYEGYEFKRSSETGYRFTESGAYKAMMTVPEVFFLSHFHIDMGEHFKLMAKVGLYGGYRLKIHRILDEDYAGVEEYEKYVDAFRDYDRRLSYGVEGGVGFGLMFNPFEFHLMVTGKWGWSSFWQPDYVSPYYYRFAYPLDAGLTFGVYYQLTPRYGHTRAQLKKLARKMMADQQQQKP